MLAHRGRRCGVNLSWRSTEALGQRRLLGVRGGVALLCGHPEGASRGRGGGRAYNLDSCGRLGRRDERTQGLLRCIPRSLVSAPAVHHSMSRWRRPAAGWGSRTELLCG